MVLFLTFTDCIHLNWHYSNLGNPNLSLSSVESSIFCRALVKFATFAVSRQLSAHAQYGPSAMGTMAADSALLLSLVEEYVSGLQDSKAKDTATG